MTRGKCWAFVLTLTTSHGTWGQGVVLLLLSEEERGSWADEIWKIPKSVRNNFWIYIFNNKYIKLTCCFWMALPMHCWTIFYGFIFDGSLLLRMNSEGRSWLQRKCSTLPTSRTGIAAPSGTHKFISNKCHCTSYLRRIIFPFTSSLLRMPVVTQVYIKKKSCISNQQFSLFTC